MTTVAYPTLTRDAPSEYSFGQRSNALVHTSPLSGSVQTVELPGARWLLSVQYANLIDPDAGLMEAFLAKLRGQANRFSAYDLRRPEPKGTLRGTLVTSGTTAAGATSVIVTGGSAGQTVLAGDKFAIGGELKMAVAPATANGAGQVTLAVEPPFRGTHSAGATVAWSRPTALFMLTTPDWRVQAVAGGGPRRPGHFAFDAIEVFA